MARGPLRFRQRDLSAALKALQAAGIPVARVEVGKEGITIVPGEPAKKAASDIEAAVAKFDRRMAQRRAAKQGEVKN